MLRSFANQQSLKNHYVEFYDVDEIKHFYRKLFTKDNVFVPIKCFRCDYFCINRREKKNHNFLTHYQLGGRQPIEDKPLKNTLFDENLKRYCTDFSEHGTFHNFYNFREAVPEFLKVFENNYTPNADLRQSSFKCSFTIVNQQPAQEMVLLKLQIVGTGKRMCMKASILTILLNQIWLMRS